MKRELKGQRTFAYTYPQAHRRSDPISSELAEDEITVSGLRGRQALQVFHLLRRFNGSTSAELAQCGQTERHMVARRLPDLQHNGFTKKGEIRMCNANGRKAVTWWIV